MPAMVTPEDMQLSTNRIVNNLLVENMNLGAMNEALERTLSETEQQLSKLRAEKADANGEVPEEVAS